MHGAICGVQIAAFLFRGHAPWSAILQAELHPLDVLSLGKRLCLVHQARPIRFPSTACIAIAGEVTEYQTLSTKDGPPFQSHRFLDSGAQFIRPFNQAVFLHLLRAAFAGGENAAAIRDLTICEVANFSRPAQCQPCESSREGRDVVATLGLAPSTGE